MFYPKLLEIIFVNYNFVLYGISLRRREQLTRGGPPPLVLAWG